MEGPQPGRAGNRLRSLTTGKIHVPLLPSLLPHCHPCSEPVPDTHQLCRGGHAVRTSAQTGWTALCMRPWFWFPCLCVLRVQVALGPPSSVSSLSPPSPHLALPLTSVPAGQNFSQPLPNALSSLITCAFCPSTPAHPSFPSSGRGVPPYPNLQQVPLLLLPQHLGKTWTLVSLVLAGSDKEPGTQ